MAEKLTDKGLIVGLILDEEPAESKPDEAKVKPDEAKIKKIAAKKAEK